MFKELKERYEEYSAYKKALHKAKHEQRLKNVHKEAEIREKQRLERMKNQKPFSFNLNKPNSTKKPNTTTSKVGNSKVGNIMDMEF